MIAAVSFALDYPIRMPAVVFVNALQYGAYNTPIMTVCFLTPGVSFVPHY